MRINRIALFNRLRTYNLYQKILQHQVQGIDAIIDEWESKESYTDLRHLAYILGTVYHETDKTMQPIEEYSRGAGRDYGKKLKYGQGAGKRVQYQFPDKIYYGRGHTQNTWYEIYEKLTKAPYAIKMGWDFLNHPELLLEMKPSIWATFYAMTTGLYTGRKLSRYFNDTVENWDGARAIVNGEDKAELISTYSKKFLKCLLVEDDSVHPNKTT